MLRNITSTYAFTLSSIVYLVVYSIFTGAIQYIPAQHLGLNRIYVIFTSVETQTYTGPMMQIIGEGFILAFRIISIAVGAAIALLVGFNIGIMWRMYRLGKLKTCLVGGAGGGSGALIANLACSAYLCCGWAPSLLVLGTALSASLTTITTPISISLLTVNAILLTKKTKQTLNPQQ
ncbi:MAG TPA: hypothetical protein EYH45_03030 [Candidatus Caldiarchaeum subterraneum]|uniref:Uncharacterized protein n=1 Tax=Caldiarchaeum subterraneum TaxID=311458 RepID=A0A832ZVB3_CALS0|nr:hypothetical protein [Candidatus Caldarchaeum subterraneum]